MTWNEEETNYVEKNVALQMVDRNWTKHIDTMAKLREAIYLRSYANTNPLQAYTNEGYDKFEKMIETIGADIVKMLLHVQIRRRTPEEIERIKQMQLEAKKKAEEQMKQEGQNKESGQEVKAQLLKPTANKKATILSGNEEIMNTLRSATLASDQAINTVIKKDKSEKDGE